MPDIARRFSDPRPIILDGATSTELQRLGVPMSGDTWSGLATITHPDVLRDLHVEYLKTGAEVITANTDYRQYLRDRPPARRGGGVRRSGPRDQHAVGGVGGCCGLGPEHIRAVSERLRA